MPNKNSENPVNASRTSTAVKKTAAPRLHKKATPVTVSVDITVSHDDIAKLAYSYWESRGKQGGSPEQDWLRAESQLRERTSAATA